MTEPMGERGRQGAAPLGGHTPGPWYAQGGNVVLPALGDKEISCWTDADARLIAAAPDLLAALERIAEHLALYPRQPLDRGCYAVVAAAIAQARGEQ